MTLAELKSEGGTLSTDISCNSIYMSCIIDHDGKVDYYTEGHRMALQVKRTWASSRDNTVQYVDKNEYFNVYFIQCILWIY